MRKAIVIVTLLVYAAVPAATASMTELERQRLVAHLEMTAGWLIDEVSNLSRAQLDFRPEPGSWRILDVLEHLVVVGPIYWSDLQKALASPPGGRVTSGTDADILWYGIDRTNREKAIPPENPTGQLPSLSAGLDSHRKQRAQLLQYVRTTKDDLRRHIVERQGCDAYQWALLISTHDQRHILQIREIKADPRFPKPQ